MPTYCYITDDGKRRIQLVCPIGKQPQEVELRGCKARRDFRAESAAVPPTKGWPIECIGSGVHASQAGELRDHLKKQGVPTRVTPSGNPVYRNAAHRRRALKARGLVDKSSYV